MKAVLHALPRSITMVNSRHWPPLRASSSHTGSHQTFSSSEGLGVGGNLVIDTQRQVYCRGWARPPLGHAKKMRSGYIRYGLTDYLDTYSPSTSKRTTQRSGDGRTPIPCQAVLLCCNLLLFFEHHGGTRLNALCEIYVRKLVILLNVIGFEYIAHGLKSTTFISMYRQTGLSESCAPVRSRYTDVAGATFESTCMSP
ncbi:hypothetical protein SISNIDRAFT_248166 [Sistotremastrum niveocremeum HHB9708]|uniref:Uncharacterized protein n=1 Tax=Sistotremastrum niveocremeum HHB9708 TaxID=1314777 RepID=A0A164YTR4_9AGAM|nr:hypothetical protein SISNIDRAFT_248166 [Sistotremastrum niveocremeum HHB9708]